jgi:hypothetical protein
VADFYYALNQVAVDLQQAKANTLIVCLDSQTPNLERYEAAINDGKWQPVKSGFEWELREGTNRLRLRTVNAFGRCGRESTIGITRGAAR